ncbi:MAG: DNA mismatch repair protein MutL [Flavobacteriales bacterium CG_4_9_14_3_um_filter_40_17]|nr:MAG: DNA mismatch repair protein MutL [Flavobacteriales bacterium CG_4_9_14_3_um_filter_40_17]
MADIIQLLPDHVANQIAAGEVVQRPASAVKELLENAMDAQASRIKLIVKDSGKTLIQVIDDGMGMSTTDARFCFERHATSKIKTADDLFRLHTKGFRGEALASIAAVAQVELATKQAENEIGTKIHIEGSKILRQEPAVTPKGTSVAVRRLFFNIPARRQFLKSDSVEFRHIIDEFHRIALTHPNTAFQLFHNDNELFNLPVSNLRQRIVSVFGGRTNEKLVPLSEVTDLVGIGGFVGKPEFARRSKAEQFFFVNQRYIRNPYLHHAVISAYDGLIKDGTQPSYFIYLDINPASIDINIHPTKTEIKFENEQALYAILRASVKHSLGQFSAAAVLDFDQDQTLEVQYEQLKTMPSLPKIEVDADFNPFDDKGYDKPHVFSKTSQPAWESLYIGLGSKSNNPLTEELEIDLESEEVTGSIFNQQEEKSNPTEYFQVHEKYILCMVKSGMILIDQHRAHRRILYEDFLVKLSEEKTASQQLLFPITPDFSHGEVGLLSELREHLEHAGFCFSKFDQNGVEIIGIPVLLTPEKTTSILQNLIEDLEQEIPDSYFSAIDLLAKKLSKSIAIKHGQSLNQKEQQQIIDSLFACKEPKLTPDNKTVFVRLGWDEIEKKFN